MIPTNPSAPQSTPAPPRQAAAGSPKVRPSTQLKVTVHHPPSATADPDPSSLQVRIDTYSDHPGTYDPTSPYQLGWEWLTGKGPRNHVFGRQDPITELLRKHDHIRTAVQTVCAALHRGETPPPTRDPYSVGGLKGVPLYFRDYSNVLTGGHTGNLAVTYLGSYGMSYQVDVDRTKQTADMKIHVWNTSTIGSATHPPVIGYTPFWKKHVEQPLDKQFATGPLSLTRQDFYWTEHLDLSKPECQ